ncbi:L-histidine N(alpha)-methyltransferase [Halomonas sp. McH1-25]|uniref:L-histidine N(alpha)-methyltransferase n=1 Tax=unclassified Halomonas TaxID=2609666 RepID=UPI001EF7369F|nr:MULTISPECIES: L-histidine N(alpha)-methyltransferase [unclassified Halomonas]MCG7600835.1 L-histidine N(alpha)-methyltransferase [Halomonas sp. McH1-25]MCP1344401.1 L-histidine N(alpha)-methyltransferase [Halomonas sp. FL8]MCP1362423.1 L-histidine N(alpha)-methyltransferase [Halomonas sp. BBD45]MCP1364857.1 L-histidine N(alpha)-methyltransferase [Halomonas sp. BBD48]
MTMMPNAAAAVRFHDHQPPATSLSLRDELLQGLRASPKTSSPKFFYDLRGSELFDLICVQPEYYPTRTEEAILRDAAGDIADVVGKDATLIELGSGASRKVRLLLEAVRPTSYLGIDISRDFLLNSTRRLAADYPWLDVHAACADFSQRMTLPTGMACEHPVAFFPGSSIGNFAPEEAESFLRGLHSLLPSGSGLLIGVDLIKDEAILNAAYNDAAGVTAAFNLNLLERLRDEFEGDLDPATFSHHAFYDTAHSRIEMHLVSNVDQDIRVAGEIFHFERGETLHTENSYKYSADGFRTLAARAGFESRALWTDPDRLFSIHYLLRA